MPRRSRTTNHPHPTVQYRPTIKQWPEGERPREKLFQFGPTALSDAELLAILIRAGKRGETAVDLGKKLLLEDRTLGDVSKMGVAELEAFGIGRSRAAAIVAAFELTRRLPFTKERQRPTFRTPADVAEQFGPRLRDLAHEEFWVLHLTATNRYFYGKRVTTGTLTASLVHPRECFRSAIQEGAASVIVVHNHPSGNPEPSQEDIAITKQLVESGKVVGIPVHDHIIIAGATYTSLAERGLI